MRELFGTDGIRGQANRYPITPEVALQLGKVVAHVFADVQGQAVSGDRVLVMCALDLKALGLRPGAPD